MEILLRSALMLTEHPLCNPCLGRQFALLGYGTENENRGDAIKLLLTMKGHQTMISEDNDGVALLKIVASNGSYDLAIGLLTRLGENADPENSCFLCEGKFKEIDKVTEKILRKLKNYEFKTFLIGVELPLKIAEQEDEFKARFSVTHGESMKSQFSRDIGKRVSQLIDKKVDYKNPDLVILINPFTNKTRLQINPLYIAGRYRKLVRGIPQSRWLCGDCIGEGCEKCNWTGKKYQESIEGLIGNPMLEVAEGKEITLHGSGREDVDARMLGSGRPFVLEIKEPRRRILDLQKLEQTINKRAKGKIEIHKLCFTNKNMVRRLKKMESAEKVYRTVIEFGCEISDGELERVEKALSNSTIYQQTPNRVLHRRADLTREKHIYKAKIKRLAPNRAEMQIHCQGGLYIKELVTGDEGRTKPSVKDILDIEAMPLHLDVLSVVIGKEEK
ncbi:MAG: tRNA pseudouridine(54/55) synthase Pus10 [Candidatus Bathyarchaeota archaeon]|nr:MAG: tRNA pseudouridine(54/55) synthase Pus10 [Candidatus Bathyarchaeota archaeon]